MTTRVAGKLPVQGHDVAYIKQGSGPPAVIVHGIASHKEDFGPVMDLLATKLTVYAFDMLGFGASSKEAPSIGPSAQADVIVALADAEGHAKVHVIGNSTGAWVATHFAAKHPDRVDKLIISNAVGLRATLSGMPPVNPKPESVEEMEKLLAALIVSPAVHTNEYASKAFADFEASGEAVMLDRFFSGAAQGRGLIEDLLPEVTAETLVLWGERDGLIPIALADVAVAASTGARKVVLPNVGHLPHVDDPSGFSRAILEFIG